MKKLLLFLIILLMITTLFYCSDKENGKIPDEALSTKSGSKYVVITPGRGLKPKQGQRVVVHYTGSLLNGQKFDSSYDTNQAIEFTCGTGEMIAGFDEGVSGMRIGEKRKLYLSPDLAYGHKGIPGLIPPNSTFNL